MLVEHQEDRDLTAEASSLRSQIAELDKRIANLISAIEMGGDLSALANQLARRSSERAGLEARIRQQGAGSTWTTVQMTTALDELGGLAELLPAADPQSRQRIYASLGLRLEYNHELKNIRATADKACVPGRVRGGT